MESDLRDLIVERDRYCGWCGGINHYPAVHHRRLRSQGGRDDAANLIALHHGCHNGSDSSVHRTVGLAQHRGFIVPSWADPAETPLHVAGGTVLLHSDGTITTVTKETWA